VPRLSTVVHFELSEDSLEDIVQRLRDQLQLEQQPASSPWLTADEAADYLRCPLSRVRRLTMSEQIPVHREGRRVLYRRDELDEFVFAGGAEPH
jgi:excisionase family DNA binding protein